MKRIRMNAENRTAFWKGTNGTANIVWEELGGGQSKLTIQTAYHAAFGMGEKYNALNQKGNTVINQVEEKFCFQGEKTYCTAPFFWTDTGIGLYVDTLEATKFTFRENEIVVSMPDNCDVVLFSGTPTQMLQEYMGIFGEAKLPPKWAFGPWVSANHWNSQQKIEQALDELQKNNCPATVMVAEAWSDEATFYIFNEAGYTPKPNGQPLHYEDFDFSTSTYWPNPKGLLEKLHQAGAHLVLWQIPVYKKQGSDETLCQQNELDREDAVQRGLCVHTTDGSPYTIPEGHWFAGSMIPDFYNPQTVHTWFAKRKYLLDMGVDGFKTDGGEFVYSEELRFATGNNGRQGVNGYAQSYTDAYTKFIGGERVLFSRAGYSGQHTTPCHWAGDQQSVNSELYSALRAGLSAAMTGIPFWGFDIAGFAGPLPTVDLYRRATMMGCFCPIMQWHSEPDGGQFRELMPGGEGNNERSPWNMEAAWGEHGFTEEMSFWHRLRMNLIPYIYSEAIRCVEESRPMMRPLAYEYPQDINGLFEDSEYLLGDSLLIAPLLEENQHARKVYLPKGRWYALFSQKVFDGEQIVQTEAKDVFPVFLREGCALVFNVPKGCPLGTNVGSYVETYVGLRLILAGKSGSYRYHTQLNGTPLLVKWDETGVFLPKELNGAEVEQWT